MILISLTGLLSTERDGESTPFWFLALLVPNQFMKKPCYRWLNFAWVVQARSFSQAAHAANQAKSAVAKRIARLEERLGMHLLPRTTRKLSLTPEGLWFYEHCAARVRGRGSRGVDLVGEPDRARAPDRECASDLLPHQVPMRGNFSMTDGSLLRVFVEHLAAHFAEPRW